MDTTPNSKTNTYIGEPDFSTWSTAYYYSAKSPENFARRGTLLATISLEGPLTFDASKAGNFVIDLLHESYFESTEDSVLLALEKSVQAAKDRLLLLVENDEVVLEEGLNFDLCAVAIVEGFAYIVNFGDSKFILQRGIYKNIISEDLKAPTGKSEFKVGSLALEPDDRMMLLSPVAAGEVSDSVSEKSLKLLELNALSSHHFGNESLVAIIVHGENVDENALEEARFHVYGKGKNHQIEVARTSNKLEGAIAPEQKIQEPVPQAPNTPAEANISNATQFAQPAEHLEEEIIRPNRDSFRSKTQKASRSATARKFKIYLENFLNSGFVRAIGPVFSSFLGGLVGLGAWFLDYLKTELLGLKKEKKIYTSKSPRKFNYRPLLLLGLLLLISGYFIYTSIEESRNQKQLEFDQELVYNDISKRVENLEVNINSVVNVYAREAEKTELLVDAKMLISDLDKLTLETYNSDKDAFRTKAEDWVNKLERKVTPEVELIKDFAILESVEPSDFVLSSNQIFVSDKKQGDVYKMAIDGSGMLKIASNVEKITDLEITSFDDLVFLSESKDRILGVIDPNAETEEEKVKTSAGLTPERLGNVKKIDAYEVREGDNRLYAIRTDANEVIQMRRNSSGYNIPELRIENENFGNLIDLEVNEGRIYLLDQTNGIMSFFGDTKTQSTVAGLVNGDNLNATTCFTIGEDFVYLCDPTKSRIIVLSKSRGNDNSRMDYILNYNLGENLPGLTELQVDEDRNSLYALGESRIIKIKLDDLTEFRF